MSDNPMQAMKEARRYLLLASYCGGETGCTERRPCNDCLAMCNVFRVADDEPEYDRELGPAAFTEPAAAMPRVPEREAIARIIDPCTFSQLDGIDTLKQTRLSSGFMWPDPEKVRERLTAAANYAFAKADAILALIPSHSGKKGEVERLREAFGRLIRVAAGEAASDDPQGIDGSEVDAAYDALWASYPTVFTEEQTAALRAWQECDHTHSLTCANQPHGFSDEDGDPVADDLVATPNGLFCVGCDYRQTWAPEVCFGPLPPSPSEIFTTPNDGGRDDAPIAQPPEEEA